MTHFVNSEAIFSIIGDYPVTDQYDILYSSLAAGSIYDNYVTGSLLRVSKNFFTGKVTYVALHPSESRGLVFSKLSVDAVKTPGGTRNASYGLQPWRERAGIIRNVRLFTNEERYYDSLTPNLSQMVSALNGKILKWDLNSLGLGIHNAIFFDNDPYNPFEETTGFSPTGFEESFPFEPIFSKIKRTKIISDSFVSTTQWTGVASVDCNEYKTSTLLVSQLYSGSHFFGGGPTALSYNANYWVDDLRFTNGLYLFGSGTLSNPTSKILFGFGDRNLRMKKSDTSAVYGKKNLPQARTSYDSITATAGSVYGYYLSLGPIIRGWKYGLIDGNPHYTSCVFRRDRFGQFRDMLEKRLNTAFIADEVNNHLKYFGNVETPALPPGNPPKSQITAGNLGFANLPSLSTLFKEPPVRVNFTRQSYIESTKELLYFSEQPQNTWSSNLSQFATSSLPYFDDISRNRNPIVNHPGTTVISSLSDLFGNIVMGA